VGKEKGADADSSAPFTIPSAIYQVCLSVGRGPVLQDSPNVGLSIIRMHPEAVSMQPGEQTECS
jgi:hypothetical protein